MTEKEKGTRSFEGCDNPPVTSSLLLTEHLVIIPLALHV